MVESDLNPPLASANKELGVVGTGAHSNMDNTSDAQAEQQSIQPSETTAGTSTSSNLMNLREQLSITHTPPRPIPPYFFAYLDLLYLSESDTV